MLLSDVLAMEWSPERNLALRDYLELRDGEVGMVNQGDVVQVVVADRVHADEMRRLLTVEPRPGWMVSVTRRPDGRWLVTGRLRDNDEA